MHNSCIEKREGGTRRQDEDEDEKRREAARVVREEGFQEVVAAEGEKLKRGGGLKEIEDGRLRCPR
jgi:hypothetical protein